VSLRIMHELGETLFTSTVMINSRLLCKVRYIVRNPSYYKIIPWHFTKMAQNPISEIAPISTEFVLIITIRDDAPQQSRTVSPYTEGFA
jgi:hypothetical protein